MNRVRRLRRDWENKEIVPVSCLLEKEAVRVGACMGAWWKERGALEKGNVQTDCSRCSLQKSAEGGGGGRKTRGAPAPVFEKGRRNICGGRRRAVGPADDAL